MKKIALIVTVFALYSCGNSTEQNNQIAQGGKEQSNHATPTKRSSENKLGNFGKVTEEHPEDNIRFRKIILSDPYEFKERMDLGCQVVDVRTAEDFAKGHIAGAINIDLEKPDFNTLVKPLISKRPILVYSQKGVKSQEATHVLETVGFQKIYSLDGGYDAWKKKGL